MSPQSRKLERLLNLVAALFESSVPLTADVLRARVGGYPEQHASFQQFGVVCTKACTAIGDCPTGWSCNMMGRCRPPN